MLHTGEKLGKGGENMEIVVDPLEGTTICARYDNDAMVVIALGGKGTFLHIPDLYMQKIAISNKYPRDIININKSVRENVLSLARYKNCYPKDITIIILDRKRHQYIINEARDIGVKIRLIRDGDISAVIAAVSDDNDIDMYIGTGGAPEGMLSATALKCIGGRMQCKLLFNNDRQLYPTENMDINDMNKVYEIEDLVTKDAVFCATGVTNGYLVDGIRKNNSEFITETLLLDSANKKSHKIRTTRYGSIR